MKMLIIRAAHILGCLSVVSLPACTCKTKIPVAVGAISPVVATKPEVVAAANFAVKEEEKVLRNEKKGLLSLVTILGAEEQVVAGMNYRLKLKVTLDGQEKTAVAVVWWQAWNEKTPYTLTSWDWE